MKTGPKSYTDIEYDKTSAKNAYCNISTTRRRREKSILA